MVELYSLQTTMRRRARLTMWKIALTPLLLLSSTLFNLAAAAGNDTNTGIPPLLGLIASLHQRHRPDVIQQPEALMKSPPPAAVRQSRPRLPELAPLLVPDTLRAAKLSKKKPRFRSQLFPERRESQSKAGPASPRARSRHIGFFYRVHILRCAFTVIDNLVALSCATARRTRRCVSIRLSVCLSQAMNTDVHITWFITIW